MPASSVVALITIAPLQVRPRAGRMTPCGRVSLVSAGAAGSAAAAATGCGAGCGVGVVAHAVAQRRASIERYRMLEIVANVASPRRPALPAGALRDAEPTP